MKAPRAYDSSVQNLFTTEDNKTARIPVDSQQTSFEENRQFKFFDELDIPKQGGSQVVYYVESANPFILFNRMISFYQGGAIYRIYRDDGTHTVPSVTPANPVIPVNSDLTDSGLSVHPTSTITLSKATGINIFTAGSGPTTGISVRAGTQSRSSSGSIGPDDNRLGFRANFSGWIVFTVIDGLNDNSVGEYELFFEERF